MNKKIILFDIDYTLFDTTKFKERIANALSSLVPHTDFAVVDDIYDEVRLEGNFDPKLFAKLFKEKHATEITEEEIEGLWFDKDIIQQALYPEVLPTLQKLQAKNDLILGIFSAGKKDFQIQKISSLQEFFPQQDIYIAGVKESILHEVLETYKHNTIVLVDDIITILQKAKLLRNDIFTIWVKRGKFAEKAEIPEGFKPDAIVTDLAEIVAVVDKSL